MTVSHCLGLWWMYVLGGVSSLVFYLLVQVGGWLQSSFLEAGGGAALEAHVYNARTRVHMTGGAATDRLQSNSSNYQMVGRETSQFPGHQTAGGAPGPW